MQPASKITVARSVVATSTLVLSVARGQLAPEPRAIDKPVDDVPAAIVAPTQGRPQFATPGSALNVVARLPGASTPRVALVAQQPTPQRIELEIAADAGHDLSAGVPVTAKIPTTTPRQTWDLEIRDGTTTLLARRAVAVCDDLSRIRLVHLSDMNVGEIGVADFESRLTDDINLLAPTLIVATGDYLDISHEHPDDGWRKLSNFFARFDAPVLAACGDHDDIARYSATLAPSAIGSIDIGPHRGIVLFDTTRRPISEDRDQLAWLERVLSTSRATGVTLVVAHDDSLRPLRTWAAGGALRDYVRNGRVGLWFAGGHRDYDGQSQRDLLAAAAPLRLIQTEQSSGLARDGASGTAHFRVIDLDDERAMLPHDANAVATREGAIPSLPVGRLSIAFDSPNDGSQARVGFVATNNHAFHLGGLRARTLVKAADDAPPWVLGGRLQQAVRIGPLWACDISFDLPDKGGTRILVGVGEKPLESDVAVTFDVPARVALLAISEDALARITPPHAIATLRNRSAAAIDAIPFVRLDGSAVPYRILGDQTAPATAYRVHLEPAEQIALQLDLSTVRVLPGIRELQVYVKGGLAWRAATTPLLVSSSSAALSATGTP